MHAAYKNTFFLKTFWEKQLNITFKNILSVIDRTLPVGGLGCPSWGFLYRSNLLIILSNIILNKRFYYFWP